MTTWYWEGQEIEGILKGTPNTSGRIAAQCFDYLVQKFKANAELITYKVQKVPNRNSAKNLEAKNRTRKLKPNFKQKYTSCIIEEKTYAMAEFSQLMCQNFLLLMLEAMLKASLGPKSWKNFLQNSWYNKLFAVAAKQESH